MSYQTEGYEGAGQRGGRLQDESRAYRDEVEEEPTDLDAPASDGLDDDELEDVKIEAEEVDDEGGEDDDADEPASPLAEDAPILASEEEEDEDGAESAVTEEEEEELGSTRARGAQPAKSGKGGKRAVEGPGGRRRTRRTTKMARA